MTSINPVDIDIKISFKIKLNNSVVRFEVPNAVTMKNVFWNIKPFVLHRRNITSPLQSQAS
jgi:hypothetical protein